MAAGAGSPIMQLYHDSSSLFSAACGGEGLGCVKGVQVSCPHAEEETSFSKETVKPLEFR